MKPTWLVWMGMGASLALLGCSAGGNDRSKLGGTDDDTSNATGSDGDGDGSGGSNGGRGGNGGSDGSGDGGSDNICSEHAVRNDRVTPDMLIVLDRSSSMNTGTVDRWTPSVAALESITSKLDDTIHFGLEVFPGDASGGSTGGGGLGGIFGGGGNFAGFCDPGTIFVPIGEKTAGAIKTTLDGMRPQGGTPTAASLKVAHDQFANQGVDPDKPTPPKFVLLVTDGAPNCTGGSFGGGGGFGGGGAGGLGDTQAVNDTVNEISSMAKDGIKTYVIGYDTQNDPTLAPALDMMAVAGDTGDQHHRPVEDESSLVKAFEEIAGKAISCEYVLEEAPKDPSYVLVTIDGEQLNLDDPNGWKISADNKKITVQGSACAKLEDGQPHVLDVKVLCEVVVPI